jgi:hypothetical protein
MTEAAARAVRELGSQQSTAELAQWIRGDEPVVIRGLVSDWPIVAAAAQGVAAAGSFLQSIYSGAPMKVARGDPAIRGKFFYGEDMRSVNFERIEMSFDAAMQQLQAEAQRAEPASIFLQSLPVEQFFPRFVEQQRLAVLDASIAPRIWIGNALTVQTHFDLLKNIACLVAGRRRFTLFPPEQLPNLYIGPLDFTPSGVPVSMARLEAPDFEQFPRFRIALDHARVVDMLPGDALYIPFAWWHHVESQAPFNILVNYWWADSRPALNPFGSLLHAIAALREMPENERAVWRNLFDYYVFKTGGEPLAHLRPEHRGMMGEMSAQRIAEIKAILQQQLR